PPPGAARARPDGRSRRTGSLPLDMQRPVDGLVAPPRPRAVGVIAARPGLDPGRRAASARPLQGQAAGSRGGGGGIRRAGPLAARRWGTGRRGGRPGAAPFAPQGLDAHALIAAWPFAWHSAPFGV